jgi:protein-disulfide isomerase
MIFLDRNFPESKLSSLRATMAWGCAVDAGKTIEYHSGIFAMQPAREGDGYSDEQLFDLAKKVGIENEAYQEFETCYTSNKYKGWAQNSELHAKDRGVQGTPSIFLNDKALDAKAIYDPAGFAEAVAAAKK